MNRCQMTTSFPTYPNSKSFLSYEKCGKPAKFRAPNVEMGVEFVCGIHANSLNKMYERTGQTIRCEPILKALGGE